MDWGLVTCIVVIAFIGYVLHKSDFEIFEDTPKRRINKDGKQ